MINIDELNSHAKEFELYQFFSLAISQFGKKIALASSFGPEDLVLMHHVIKNSLPIEIFVLDTGRLPNETYDLIEDWTKLYGNIFKIYYPNPSDLEHYVSHYSVNAFFHSSDLRKKCCHIRKVLPLNRALSGSLAWFTGLRKEQSIDRSYGHYFSYDDHGRVKIAPLLDWKKNQVWDYISKYHIPFNRLHTQGYASIGCAPCSRPIEPYEDERAGRWWWEGEGKKECGLHLSLKEMNHDVT